MQKIKLCKTCGHFDINHDSNKCNVILSHYAKSCPCNKYVEIEISDKRQLSKEFDEAWKAHNEFIQSCKDVDGIYKIADFKQAILLYARQDHLWKELTQK